MQKLELDDPLARVVDAAIADSGAALLAISKDHAVRVAALPWHHRDPFDRMLAAQAMEDELTLLSGDETFDAYGVRRVW